ncbi:lytic transglycosylase domain-containing protein [Mesorhizobium sp. M1D.F.Ca.ET.184.01.1.1]|uniref:lytic transglycosylase domain-containing protein n=1 Tax=unclassified Mesorhizobium TaxID=325217 RepID=UPI000FCBDBF1|nr:MULTISPECIES: lytic transglycosylase domain-containing protein [unclassified Mesorhizobium]TGP21390.1 lytic transglycosylase domain-containing protein [Mesorhizobium sp. M1D.F.Ca.ET.231.01.1.1]TGP28836.1 lytic transglycosylase domain-containing protein [Mesorhizobium sp. M1D.F.Ca.ET.234.01.1.1]TGS43304.1 lytic transglycosylase domain-containing protein [Mesorhizobium sp. M1D.F.Ca.ET.184.01.1.1]TGS59853.1 lytic transglycosylase domain-containing protein [Mesorhizobium sp. M1D.F.Ca.ET.183.01.1
MALSRFHSQVLPYVAPVLLATIGMHSAGSALSAEQRHETAQSTVRSAQTAGPETDSEAVDSVFRNRWLDGARQYVVSADGKLQTADGSLGDVDVGKATIAGTANDGSGQQSQFDLSTIKPALPCGPSPLTAAEIARLVVEAAQKYRVDPAFALAVSTAESRLDRDRNSPKGARGPMQLMPPTADFLGVTDICDPAANIDGGVRLLKSLFETYRNPLIVAAAYNAGETNVQKYGGVPPFPETVRFVAEVINRQIGLPLPRAKDQGTKGTLTQRIDDDAAAGVLANAKPRQWVGGVMQF